MIEPSQASPSARVAAIIVAAGRGARAGAGGPKQYRPLAGRPVLTRTLAAFLTHPRVDEVRVVIHGDDRRDYETAARAFSTSSALGAPIMGGATRQASVRSGLEALATGAAPPDWVLLHDAARPLTSPGVIDRVLSALAQHAGAIAALPVTDTLKRAAPQSEPPHILDTAARDGLWRAQTPQGFHFAPILAAHRAAAGHDLTDDAAVAEAAGLAVALTPGDASNIKLTHAEDFALAEALLAASETHHAPVRPAPAVPEYRTGQGFDVHAFEAGDHVMLCGVRVPHDHRLAGHSDADVGLHAITDAILGAAALGDIGQHFSPADPRWADADSALFLRHACDLAAERGGVLTHVDVTLICERPKVGPYRDAMTARLAAIMDLAPERVSVKATTTETLGFLGRREGIAALATATVRFDAHGRDA